MRSLASRVQGRRAAVPVTTTGTMAGDTATPAAAAAAEVDDRRLVLPYGIGPRRTYRLLRAIAVSTIALGAVTCDAHPTAGPPGRAAPATNVSSPSPVITTRPHTEQTATPMADRPPTLSTAAARYGWTNLVARDDFTGSSLHPSWRPYDSAGHAGNGIRSPEQISLSNGVLRMNGTPTGTTAGMDWNHPQQYGRWEIRARFPAGCGCYHPVLILWPVDHPWPAGGEIDYAEVSDPSRQTLKFFLHYGAENRQLGSSRRVDMTQWHNFAVEWTADHITGYLDGQPFFHTAQREALPPGPMKQTIQLDWFPGSAEGGATLEVDWATIYTL